MMFIFKMGGDYDDGGDKHNEDDIDQKCEIYPPKGGSCNDDDDLADNGDQNDSDDYHDNGDHNHHYNHHIHH